jgi:DNA-binding transcriptional LysR family regulator
LTIPPADMLLFAAVVREGSFTRAAKQLGVTKQTVSERIAKLEARLGVRLLERTTRRLRTTDSGAAYYERCATIAAQIDEANSEIQERQAEPRGLLRVSAPVLYGRRFLAPVVADILCRHSKVRVEVVLTDRRVDLIEEGFDLAIRMGNLDDSSLTARKLGEGHAYMVASPSFVAEHGVPTASTLRSLRCVGLQRFETWDVAGKRVKVEPVLVVNDLEVACDAAIAGVGIAQVPAIVCRQAVDDGLLRVLLGSRPSTVRTVYAVYPSRQYLPVKVRVFVDALVTMVEPMQPLQLSTPSKKGSRR